MTARCSSCFDAERTFSSHLPSVLRLGSSIGCVCPICRSSSGPWLGWLLGEAVQAILGREDFDNLWESRASLCAAPFEGEQRDACWKLLHRLAAGSRPDTLDLVHMRDIIARARPPVELCYPELGLRGPILGTIHASKGREADEVVLVMPPHFNPC